MTDHPSTFNAAPTGNADIDWDDAATLHRRDDGDGVLDGLKALNRGTLAEMVRLYCNLPAADRSNYVIQKAGDRRLEPGEILALADREDFPAA